jgi:CTP-dependent riboflavin kinase
MLLILRGKVAAGKGNASKNFGHVAGIMADRLGLPRFRPGTLNVMLPYHYPITVVDAIIGADEYRHRKECIKPRRCRIRKSGGDTRTLRAVIVRPSGHDNPKSCSYWKRLEIMSHHHLMTVLELDFGQEVEVEVEKDHKEDDEWWNAPELSGER